MGNTHGYDKITHDRVASMVGVLVNKPRVNSMNDTIQRYDSAFSLSDLFTIQFSKENNDIIDEINRHTKICDPASHLKRMVCIWLAFPLPDITKLIWKFYCDIYYIRDQKIKCIICVKAHQLEKCYYLNKCKICDKPGHSSVNCQYKCSCGRLHKKSDHVCYICNDTGHVEEKCPKRCSCKNVSSFKYHPLEWHICEVCSMLGHRDVDCVYLRKAYDGDMDPLWANPRD